MRAEKTTKKVKKQCKVNSHTITAPILAILRQQSNYVKTAHPLKNISGRSSKAESFSGFKFRRKHPLSEYIADFYCHHALLVIELDGDIHDHEEIKKKDEVRENAIKKLGITVLRFSNDQVFQEVENVLEKVESHLQKFK